LRTFVSVPIPREIRENTLREAKSLLEDTRIRWSKPENLHLTLKFLGEVPETSLPSIKEELARISLIHSTFEISISGLGAFPSEGRARVVWDTDSVRWSTLSRSALTRLVLPAPEGADTV